jgi:hypothetical protein
MMAHLGITNASPIGYRAQQRRGLNKTRTPDEQISRIFPGSVWSFRCSFCRYLPDAHVVAPASPFVIKGFSGAGEGILIRTLDPNLGKVWGLLRKSLWCFIFSFPHSLIAQAVPKFT